MSGHGRTLRILYALRDAPDGLTVPDLIERLGEGIEPRQKALSWYGSALRTREAMGHVGRAGKVPASYHNIPTILWRITGQGLKALAYLDDEPLREAGLEQARIRQDEAERARREALADAARSYSRNTLRPERRVAASRLRALGCRLEEIGAVFGVTREQIRQDLLPWEPKPESPRKIPGQRLVEAVIMNDVLNVRVGKRSLYFTYTEACELAEVINRWGQPATEASAWTRLRCMDRSLTERDR